jgi:hypothetical protein
LKNQFPVGSERIRTLKTLNEIAREATIDFKTTRFLDTTLILLSGHV